MNLEFYISQLLYRNQCVIVSNFGAFLTDHTSAFIHESTHAFYPPRKVVSFNANVKNNDGLLANYIAVIEKKSYQEVVLSIQNEVNQWTNNLSNKQKIVLKNIGDLAYNSDQNIVFVPLENNDFLTSSFGLSHFVSPFIKREIISQITPVTEDNNKDEETNVIELQPERKNVFSYLKYAAVLAIGIGGAGFFGYTYYTNHVETQTLLVEKAVARQVQNTIEEATFFVSEPLPTVTLSVVEEKLSYHVVVGAFRNERNAKKIYQELLDKGFNARRVGVNKFGLHPVLSGSYATRNEANEAKSILQQNGTPDAWLLVEKL